MDHKPPVSRRLHRLLGAIVMVQIIIWLITGILFNIKHRYGEVVYRCNCDQLPGTPTIMRLIRCIRAVTVVSVC